MTTKHPPRDAVPQPPASLPTAPHDETAGRLMGGIARDFNMLLTLIIANLELLEMQISDPRQRGIVARALQAAQLGDGLNRRLLALTPPRDPHPAPIVIDLEARAMAIADLLNHALRPRIGIARAEESTPCSGPALGRVKADPEALDRLLLALMLTLCDAMPEGGRISLTLCAVTLDAEQARAIPGARPGRFAALGFTAGDTQADPGRESGADMTARTLARAAKALRTPGDAVGSGPNLFSAGEFLDAAGGFLETVAPLGGGAERGPGLRLFLPRATAAL